MPKLKLLAASMAVTFAMVAGAAVLAILAARDFDIDFEDIKWD